MRAVNGLSTLHPDPFRCYAGVQVRRDRQEWVVVDHVVRDRALLFRLRQPDGGQEVLVTLLELLDLLDLPPTRPPE